MDLEYMWKKLTGTLTADDELAYQAHIAEQQGLRAQAVVPSQPEEAQGLRMINGVRPALGPEDELRMQEAEAARRSASQYTGGRR